MESSTRFFEAQKLMSSETLHPHFSTDRLERRLEDRGVTDGHHTSPVSSGGEEHLSLSLSFSLPLHYSGVV